MLGALVGIDLLLKESTERRRASRGLFRRSRLQKRKGELSRCTFPGAQTPAFGMHLFDNSLIADPSRRSPLFRHLFSLAGSAPVV
jgi:hypothetical protein